MTHRLCHVEPGAIGQPHVEQHHLGSQLAFGTKRLGGAGRLSDDVEAPVLEQLARGRAEGSLVVDQEYPGPHPASVALRPVAANGASPDVKTGAGTPDTEGFPA